VAALVYSHLSRIVTAVSGQRPTHSPPRCPLQPFTEADWQVHGTWRRYIPEPHVSGIVILSLAPVWGWSVLVSAGLGLYATYAEVGPLGGSGEKTVGEGLAGGSTRARAGSSGSHLGRRVAARRAFRTARRPLGATSSRARDHRCRLPCNCRLRCSPQAGPT
jgi:hypothetical protein